MHRRSTKPAKVIAIPGIGPKSLASLHSIGVTTLEQLQACDAFDLYQRLKLVTPGLSINFLYGLLAAQTGVHWQQVQRERRTEILLRLDDMGLAP
jgi:DNA transformation protein